jgi:hypothetical protein|tara:strand:- start:133 stop:375 length:243 start_codon:yes stop_codon:yes gene_type:complete
MGAAELAGITDSMVLCVVVAVDTMASEVTITTGGGVCATIALVVSTTTVTGAGAEETICTDETASARDCWWTFSACFACS